ncbi:MAG: YqgE/AlgH family protein [Pseudomonadota bacterium]
MFERNLDLEPSEEGNYLEGQLLIAMPGMADKRFNKAVIYMCAHSADGAMGLIINKQASNISFSELLEQLSILPQPKDNNQIYLPSVVQDMAVHKGGPVETGRGFVLHSCDYHAKEATLSIDDAVSLTATIDILRAIATGNGPDRALLALGYAGWRPGQLEIELKANGWLNCPADPNIVFGHKTEEKYNQALAQMGIDPTFLVNDVGHA